MRRSFAPSFVAVVGSNLVAVDKIQPVAVLLSPAAQVVSTVSWAHDVPPPIGPSWPHRRIGTAPDHVLVQDLAGDVAVRLEVDAGELKVAGVVDGSAFAVPDVHCKEARLFVAPQAPIPDDVDGWRFRSHLDEWMWSAEAEWHGKGVVHRWPGGPGSVISHATRDDSCILAIRRAGKRPWVFDPPFDVHVLEGGSDGIDSRRMPALDISHLCWDQQLDHDQLDRQVAEYVQHSVRQAQAARRLGARDVRVELRRIDARPVIEISFRLDEVPGVLLRRIDCPVDELGHGSGGLGELNINLAEDLEGGLVDALLRRRGHMPGELLI